ncbi:hypothetical protein PL8927_720087 [Planktothrix serta PCC 8927]|uniref:Uncharacterized protein n=1 Tax=Planktothrix serta PCC 8927 TaxID=671068 RepID=A0A7Z9BYA7_9CYAN|nr:hypothetical protein PL8927_720087 [Planktothrix serta PCC 8927]
MANRQQPVETLHATSLQSQQSTANYEITDDWMAGMGGVTEFGDWTN